MLTGLGAGQGREVSQSLMTMDYNSQHTGQCHLNIDSVQSGAHWVVLSGGGVDIHLMEDSIHDTLRRLLTVGSDGPHSLTLLLTTDFSVLSLKTKLLSLPTVQSV